MYAKLTAENQVSVYSSNNMLLCVFQGPMARAVAAKFIIDCEKDKLASPMDLLPYIR